MLPYISSLLLGIFVIGYILGKPYWREWQRNKIKQQPFKKEWRKILQRRMPYFQSMPADLQLQLKGLIQVFIAEKRFIGCNGVVITDEIKVTIAAQACLLLLNRKTDIYPKLTSILVYPHGFVKEQQSVHAGGIHHTERTTLIGESWEFGKVVLSWGDTLEGALIPDDGHNVVIHEFAHQLDQETGQANGAPILGKDQSYESWSKVLSQEFARLNEKARFGEPSLFDYYGATNPAEFFAVATEVFFEQSQQLYFEYPKLYQEFKQYYRVDPMNWH